MKTAFVIFVLFVAVATVRTDDDNVTPAVQCKGQDFDDLRNRIQVLPCGKSKCKLRKGTNTTVLFRFNPKKKVTSLTNNVYASIGGIQLPFIGVAGTTACNHITNADDGSPATCPLKAGQEYKYVNVFFIQELYPVTNLVVHWALNDGKDDVICFEVAAAITAAKN